MNLLSSIPGPQGATGAAGSNGTNGTDGDDGAPGADGSPRFFINNASTLTTRSSLHVNGTTLTLTDDGAGPDTITLALGSSVATGNGSTNAVVKYSGSTAAIVVSSITDDGTTIALGNTGNLTLLKENAHSIVVVASTTAATAGGALTIKSGDGNGAAGGAVVIDTGSGGTSAITIGGTNATSVVLGRSGQSLGFFGATAAVKQTSGANLTNSVTSGGTTDQIDDITDLYIYANDSALIRNAIYQLAKKLKQVNDGLRTLGLFT